MLPIYTNLFYAVLLYMCPAIIENVRLFQEIPLRNMWCIYEYLLSIFLTGENCHLIWSCWKTSSPAQNCLCLRIGKFFFQICYWLHTFQILFLLKFKNIYNDIQNMLISWYNLLFSTFVLGWGELVHGMARVSWEPPLYLNN